MADAAQQHHVFRPVVTAAAAALQRLDRGEASFPESQNVLREIELFGSFRDGTEGVWRLVQNAGLPGVSTTIDALSTRLSGC
ncbi:hypothetical protein D3C87_1741530 [compost metagenome]